MEFVQEDSIDPILKFCNITNAPKEVAATYLEVSEGNVEQAVNMFLESGGVNLNGFVNPTTTEDPQQSTSTYANARSMIDSDAELARALSQQESSPIRAPIAPKREILVGGDQNDHVGLDSGMIRRGVPRSRRSRDNTYRTFAGDALHRIGTSDEKATSLADLYSPPFDIINKENFEKTRTKAKTDGKWVMVDIQNISVFACQALNVDLWRDNTVKEVIKKNFLFLQYNSESPDGRTYITYYPIQSYPHIAIIDPRTGERVKVWSTPQLAPNEFIIDVMDFLANFSLTDQKKQSSTTKPLIEISEEEPILAATNKSPEREQSKEKESESENFYHEEIDTEEEDDDSMEEIEPISTFNSIQPVEREEAQGPTSAMIKFRLADGQTIIRRFEKLNPVRYLFEYIKAAVPSLKNQEFELVCHNRNSLINQVEQTIEEAGLSNSLINVVVG